MLINYSSYYNSLYAECNIINASVLVIIAKPSAYKFPCLVNKRNNVVDILYTLLCIIEYILCNTNATRVEEYRKNSGTGPLHYCILRNIIIKYLKIYRTRGYQSDRTDVTCRRDDTVRFVTRRKLIWGTIRPKFDNNIIIYYLFGGFKNKIFMNARIKTMTYS